MSTPVANPPELCDLPSCQAVLLTQRYEIRQVRPARTVTVTLCSWKCLNVFAKRYSMARQSDAPAPAGSE